MENREIKFSYILQRDNGNFGEIIFGYKDIFSGAAKRFLSDLSNQTIVAKRQFTGLKCAKENDIYEGDVFEAKTKAGTFRYVVLFEDGKFVMNHVKKDYGKWGDLIRIHEVKELEFILIGNIYANPELLNS